MTDVRVVGIVSALGGLVVGLVGGVLIADKKLRGEYEAATEAMREGYERALNGEQAPIQEAATKIATAVEEATETVLDHMPTAFEPTGSGYKPGDVNPYHTNVEPTSVLQLAMGVVNEHGICYITEEDYEKDDGRIKNLVSAVVSDMGAQFFIDGMLEIDWEPKLGPTIMVDMARFGVPTLYVRNTNTDEDYEVMRERP